MLNRAKNNKKVQHSEVSEKLRQLNEMLIQGWDHVETFTPLHGWIVSDSYQKEKGFSVDTKFLNYNIGFSAYCEALLLQSYPFKERFVVYGKHWNCGEVRINESGDITLLLLDSFPKYLTSKLDIIKKTFSERSLTVYYPELPIQRDTHNCAIFAIDNWKRLDKVENYLPVQYNGDLFEYLRIHSELDFEGGGVQICKVQLPLYLMKLMQSRKLVLDIIPGRTEENALALNRQGETAYDACFKYYRLDSNGDIFINDRVKDKKAKFIARGRAAVLDPDARKCIVDKLTSCNFNIF